MSKAPRKQPSKDLAGERGATGTAILEGVKSSKSSVIVLAFAALMLAAAMSYLYSEDVMEGIDNIHNVYGDEPVEFEKATVVAIVSENIDVDETIDNAYTGNQELLVTVESGRYQGEQMTVYNYFGPNTGVPVEAGDGVKLTIKTHANGEHSATVF